MEEFMTDYKSMLERISTKDYLEKRIKARLDIGKYLSIAEEELLSRLKMRDQNKEIVMMQLDQNADLKEDNALKLAKLNEEISFLTSECDHELVLCLGEHLPFDNNPIPYSVCLCCGSPIRLENTGSDRVLDVRGKVEPGAIYASYEGKSMLVHVAQELLTKLSITNPDISMLQIKEYLMASFLNIRQSDVNLERLSLESDGVNKR